MYEMILMMTVVAANISTGWVTVIDLDTESPRTKGKK
jgi:hypothetical protein